MTAQQLQFLTKPLTKRGKHTTKYYRGISCILYRCHMDKEHSSSSFIRVHIQ